MLHYDYIYILPIFPPNFGKVDRAGFAYHFQFLNDYTHLQNKSVLIICSIRGPEAPGGEVLSSGQSQEDDATHRRWISEKHDVVQHIKGLFDKTNISPQIELMFDFRPNYGGTVAALWDSWKHILQDKITAKYVVCTEDDWLHSAWDDREWVLEQGYFCVGMMGGCGSGYGYKTILPEYFQSQNSIPYASKFNGRLIHMMDGGLYFIKYESLEKIEARIGSFTKAPSNEAYDHSLHGILYGEVGFPGEMWEAGMRFYGMSDLSLTLKRLVDRPTLWYKLFSDQFQRAILPLL